MSNLYTYAANRSESAERMNRLDLSEDFSNFKLNQEARHQESLKKFEKTKIGSLMLTTAGTLGVAGCMIGGVLSAPALIAGIAAVYAIGGIGVGAKLGEMFSKSKHDRDYGSADIFLKTMDEQNHSMGDEFYSEFVERMEKKPALAASLSEVSKKFKAKKESFSLEESLSNEIDNQSNEVRQTNSRKRKINR